MSKPNPSEVPLHVMEELRSEYIVLFLAELLKVTDPPDKQEAFQAALQAYCDSLRPWLEPSDWPLMPRDAFSPLEECAFDVTGENITVVLSQEAEAFFRAWQRRNQILHNSGVNTAHVWLN